MRFEHFFFWRRSLLSAILRCADRAVHRERNRTMARTKRSQRSYGAGEWGRNRVRVFPDAKTGLFQVEWRENGRRLTRSLGHRDWGRAKRQADEFAAGFVGPEIEGKAEAEPEPLTLGTQIGSGVNHGRESSNYLQGRTICAFCPSTATAPVVQKQRGNRLNSREQISPHGPLHRGHPRAIRTRFPSVSESSHRHRKSQQRTRPEAEN